MTNRYFLLIAVVFHFAAYAFSQESSSLLLYYEKAQTEISEKNLFKLEQYVDSIGFHHNCSINVFGYSDTDGDEVVNMKLSQGRADSVVSYLVSLGASKDMIVAEGKGEIKGIGKNRTERQKRQNRRVEIFFNCPELGNIEVDDKETSEEQLIEQLEKPFENDTVIVGKQGTRVSISAGAFYPKRIKDVKIEVQEVFSLCDSVPDDLETVTTTGVCLESGGMAFVSATYKKKKIKPNKKAVFEVKIPVPNQDATFKFYIADRKKGKLRWKESEGTIVTEGGVMYYVFHTSFIGGFNCDKPIEGCSVDSDNNYRIRSFARGGRLRLYSSNKFSFFDSVRARRKSGRLSNRTFYVPKELDPENTFVDASGSQFSLFYDPFLNFFDAPYQTKRLYKLSELDYNPKKNLYKLKRKHFQYAKWGLSRENVKKAMNCKDD